MITLYEHQEKGKEALSLQAPNGLYEFPQRENEVPLISFVQAKPKKTEQFRPVFLLL